MPGQEPRLPLTSSATLPPSLDKWLRDQPVVLSPRPHPFSASGEGQASCAPVPGSEPSFAKNLGSTNA